MASNSTVEKSRSTENDEYYLALGREALEGYEVPESASLRMLSLSENATFLVETDDGPFSILRLYRAGNQSERSIESELAWIDELSRTDFVNTPAILPNRFGTLRHELKVNDQNHSFVMFSYIAGTEPADDDLATIELVGATSARLHQQVEQWARPDWFERRTWGLEEILGKDAPWGDWRNGPNLSTHAVEIYTAVEAKIRANLGTLAIGPDTFGLVHCDLRAANLVVDSDERVWTIDFDDSGFSWFMWDLCSTTTCIEHVPNLDTIVRSWITGYQSVRPISGQETALIPDLVALRRLHIIAWMGTHASSGLTAALGATYATDFLPMAERYLQDEFLNNL